AQDKQTRVARLQHGTLQTPVDEVGAFAGPLVEPIEVVDRDEVKPDRPRGRNRMLPSGNERQNYMQLVDANEPINAADERQQKQMQRRYEQLARNNLGMVREHDGFINE